MATATLLALSPQAAPIPLDFVRRATAAVEGDSVEVVRERWSAQAADPVVGRPARLGLGVLAVLQYDLEGAEAALRPLVSERGAPADAVSVRARMALAQVARSRADMLGADSLLTAARDEADRLGDRAAATEALLVLAMNRSRTRGPEAAEALFEEAAPHLSGDPYLGALHACARADLFVLMNRDARDEADRGERLAAAAGAGRLRAACVAARASDRARAGDMEGAIRDMQESAELRRSLHDYIGLAVSLQWRGYWLRLAGRLEEARADLEEAIGAARVASARSPLAWSYANLAYIDLGLGDAPRGVVHADSAAALFALQGDRYGAGTLLGVLGDISLRGGETARAVEAYEASLATLEPVGFLMGTSTARVGLAHAAMAEGDWQEAERQLVLAAGRAGDATESDLELAYHFGVLALKRGRLPEARHAFENGLRLTAGPARAGPTEGAVGSQPQWSYHYRMRLAEISALLGDLDAAMRGASAAMDDLEAWRATLSRPELRLLAFQISEDPSDPDLGFASIVSRLAEGGRVESAYALAERLRNRAYEDRLRRIEALGRSPGADSVLASPSGLSAQEARAALPEGTALLSWVTGRGGEPTTLFVLDSVGLHAQTLPPADSIERAARRLRAALAAGDLPDATIRAVSGAVVGASLARLPSSVRRLVVVPDGPVHIVPFDVLRLSDGRPLVERFSVSVQPSVAMAVTGWRAPSSRSARSVLAVGAPTLSGPPAEELSPLPGALGEVRRAARYGRSSELLVGERASESNVKAIPRGRYGLIHFATHALLDESTLAGAYLMLAPGAGEDGILGAGEVAALQWDVPIAILSACSTAEGRVVRGEGVVGLASAFAEAGVRTVVLTRWPVEDRGQADLVEALYRGLASGLSVGDAVRAAKLELRAQGASPAVWAALVVAGDGDITLPLEAPGRTEAWTLLGLALLAAAAVAVGLRFRGRV